MPFSKYKFLHDPSLFLFNCISLNVYQLFIKNVSSSTSHRKESIFTSLRLSFREFKKILSNTFIYESILIKTLQEYKYYEYANISFLKVLPQRSLKVTKGHLSFREFEKILPNTFIYESILLKM